MSKSYRNTSNRRFKYLINQETKRKNIAGYKSLCRTLFCPASFPDSGYYYEQKSRQAEQLYNKVIVKLPYKKRVLIQAELEAAERWERKNWDDEYSGLCPG